MSNDEIQGIMWHWAQITLVGSDCWSLPLANTAKFTLITYNSPHQKYLFGHNYNDNIL